MTPAVANLALSKGTAYDVALVIQDAAAQPIDLTGCTLTASIISAASPVELAVTVTDAAAGLATVHIPGRELGMADWELWMQAATETPRERVLRGLVTVSERVDPRDEGNPSSHRLIVRISDAVTVSLDSVDLAWWAYEQTRKLLGVDYSTLCADAARTAQQAASAAHASSANAAASSVEAMRHKDAAGLSATGAATSERNAYASAQAAADASRTASDAQGAAAEDAQELRRLLGGFTLTPGRVDALPHGNNPSVSIDPGPTPGSHVLNFALVSGPQGPKGDPGTLAANAGNLDLGGHLTATGGTFAGTVNANGGINIPEAAGMPSDTAAASRAYAAGMAHLVSLHMTRLYWRPAGCTVTGGLTLDHCSPGSYCQVSLPANKRATLYMPTVGALGAGNYGKTMGYIIPVVNKANGGESWHKITMIIGEATDTWEEIVDGGVDDFRWRPVSGDSIFLRRAIEVTIYSGNSSDGYKVRVRELVPVGNPRSYVVRTTTSVLPYNSNTTPQTSIYKIVISQGKYSANDSLSASVWAIMGGVVDDTVIKLADIRGWEGYHLIYPPNFFFDVLCGPWGGNLWMESPSVINGIGQTTYIKHALEPYQRSWVTSATEAPYVYPVQ